jgi:dTMP kinase
MTGKARFITLEGGEGAGKSTQTKHLVAALGARGVACEQTREPGGSPGAEEIRKLIVHGEPDKWDAETETLLLFAARADHVTRRIRPALAQGRWVVCDRFIDSTYAYQGCARGVPQSTIAQLESLVLHGLVPDLTLILDIDAQRGLERTAGRLWDRRTMDEVRFERFGLEFHQALRHAFLEIAQRNPQRCVVIDAERPEADVADAMWQVIARRFAL